jgi:hypothetical protein
MAAVVFQGSPASVDLVRSGSSVLLSAGAATTVTVADAAITADSVVICWGVGTADATALAFTIDVVSAGVGFTLRANAAATANKTIGWAVLKY